MLYTTPMPAALHLPKLSAADQAKWMARITELVGVRESNLVGVREWENTSSSGFSPEGAVELWGLKKVCESKAVNV